MVPSVCAVVVTYNRKTLLLNCLKALQKQTIPVDKVLIIDNASSDGTTDYLIQSGILQDKRFILHTLGENLG
ncbi:MAG: glycosyl transferase, partial [Haemophilus parainfluenzae]